MRITLDIPEAARLMGVNRNTLYEAVRSGQVPALRIGRRLVILRSALEAALGGPLPEADAQADGGSVAGDDR